MNEIKPGYKTSELHVTLIAAGVTLALTYGIINQEEAQAWMGFLIALVPVLAAVYVASRTYLKSKTNSK